MATEETDSGRVFVLATLSVTIVTNYW